MTEESEIGRNNKRGFQIIVAGVGGFILGGVGGSIIAYTSMLLPMLSMTDRTMLMVWLVCTVTGAIWGAVVSAKAVSRRTFK